MSVSQVILVTGATSGFGLEMAQVLGGLGHRVYATYRRARRLGPLSALARGLPVFPLYMDVNLETTVKRAVDLVLKKEGKIDVLVNNAGFVVAGFLEDVSDAEFKAQFQTNVYGPLRAARAVLPAMRAAGSGKIINIGSISGRAVFPGIGAYAASKFALRALTQGLRQELRPFGIQATEIAPGSYATQVVRSTRRAKKSRSPLSPYGPFISQVEGLVEREFRRAAQPLEVARLVARLVEAGRLAPAYVTGTDAKLAHFFKQFLPDRLWEAFFFSLFPWSRKRA